MDIEEIKKRKHKLEREIADKILEFENATNCQIEEIIEIHHGVTQTEAGLKWSTRVVAETRIII